MGAQTHHFPHRGDLLPRAAQRIADERVGRLRALAGDLAERPADRLPALLDLMWADFSSDVFTVFVKLWVEAADDRELYDRMIEIERQLARTITEAAVDFIGELADRGGRAGYESRLLLALSALRGLALTERFEPRERTRRDPWPALRTALIESLEGLGRRVP